MEPVFVEFTNISTEKNEDKIHMVLNLTMHFIEKMNEIAGKRSFNNALGCYNFKNNHFYMKHFVSYLNLNLEDEKHSLTFDIVMESIDCLMETNSDISFCVFFYNYFKIPADGATFFVATYFFAKDLSYLDIYVRYSIENNKMKHDNIIIRDSLNSPVKIVIDKFVKLGKEKGML